MNAQVDLNGKKLSRIGEKTADIGPESHWGKDVPLYKLRETEFLFQFPFVCMEFASKKGANGRYVHMRGYMANNNGERIPGPEGETGDIAISTGAQTIMQRLDALNPAEDFPVIGQFQKGPAGPNQWFDYQ